MTKQEVTLLSEQKKLAKKKVCLLERLQEAREEQEWAARRLQKKTARVQKLEAKLQEVLLLLDDPEAEAVKQTVEPATASVERDNVQYQEPPHLQQARQLLEDAHAIAIVAERAAYVASERVLEASERIEKMFAGRHILDELAETQHEAEAAQFFAQEALRSASIVEQLLSVLEPEAIADEEPADLQGAFPPSDEEEPDEDQLLAHVSEMIRALKREPLSFPPPQYSQWNGQIDADEQKRILKLRLLLRQTELMIDLVRGVVEDGTLCGENATWAMKTTELELEHLHLLLQGHLSQASLVCAPEVVAPSEQTDAESETYSHAMLGLTELDLSSPEVNEPLEVQAPESRLAEESQRESEESLLSEASEAT
ncbi:hypothetical protein [Tengunoibacter tsumagoiensis]|uniref:Uncharacterized protein n=1 Tax=Tengunoibacter tsumagoiensis TaxID=2014871 RepID=A0A402A5N8_9CHLR|nr:hypothetical protein [Tengunoibacter tsumagoiensis]GCE14366.1 hypothetical protein KTT_42250 [Tengunoibacter tsumagoiensis]